MSTSQQQPPGAEGAQSGTPGRRRFRTGVLNDFPTKLAGERVALVFDVGANVGQSTLEFDVAFPDASIHAFEPAGGAFDELAIETVDMPAVTAHQLALGDRNERRWMRSDGAATANRLLPRGGERTGRRSQSEEEVDVITGDDFCAGQGIDRIGFLKVDTVGNDLAVVRGFHRMLGDGAVDVLQVEVSMTRRNQRQQPFARVLGYLDPLGYELMGVYGQARGFQGLPVLARADVVFLSPRAVERNTASR